MKAKLLRALCIGTVTHPAGSVVDMTESEYKNALAKKYIEPVYAEKPKKGD